MWVLTGVLERFPGLKVVFVEPGVGWVSWWLYLVDDMTTRQGYEYPGLKLLAQPLLPAERAPNLHRRTGRRAARPRSAGYRERDVVFRLSPSRFQLAQLKANQRDIDGRCQRYRPRARSVRKR